MRTNLELLIQMGSPSVNLNLHAKPNRVRVSFISNGKPTESEYEALLKSFGGKLPITIEEINKKGNFITQFLTNSLSLADQEELRLRMLEQRIKKGKLGPLNTPKECAYLR